jgi:hypothetical protein
MQQAVGPNEQDLMFPHANSLMQVQVSDSHVPSSRLMYEFSRYVFASKILQASVHFRVLVQGSFVSRAKCVIYNAQCKHSTS